MIIILILSFNYLILIFIIGKSLTKKKIKVEEILEIEGKKL